MKAIQFSKYGDPDVLELTEVDSPELNEDEVLIEVHYAGVNFKDTMVRRNVYVIPTPLPFIPGDEVSGVVKEVGKNVTRVKVGDRVATMAAREGYAEYVRVNEQVLIPFDESIDFATACALPLQGLTAYHLLKTMGRIKKGNFVLVHAAAGGVGCLAVQLAKLFGAEKVIATASSEEKLNFAEELGADIGINYTMDGWEKRVVEATDGRGVDIALEMVGGEVFQKTLQTLGDFGRVIVFGFASGVPPSLEVAQLIGRNQSASGFFLESITNYPDLMKSSSDELFSLLRDGKLNVQIGHHLPLEDAKKAHEIIEGRETRGKIVLNVKGS